MKRLGYLQDFSLTNEKSHHHYENIFAPIVTVDSLFAD